MSDLADVISGRGATRTIRVGGYAPEGSVHSRALDRFAEIIDRETDGEAEVAILYNVLDEGRPTSDLFEMVRAGELTWCYHSSSYLGEAVPALDAVEVPFLFDTVADAHRALDGDFGHALAEAVEASEGLEVLGFWDNGLRHLTNAVRAIAEPADCHGLTIRLQPNRIHEELARSWGMIPVAAPLAEGIDMIRRGDVDAQENPLANTAAYGVEHPHVTLTAHLYGARGLFADREALDDLGDLGPLVRRAARAAIDFQRQAATEYEDELRRTFEADGRLVIEPTPAERAAFAEAAGDVIGRARDDIDPSLLALLP